MKKIVDFLRKIGLLHISSGDSITGEYDSRKDLKKSSTTKKDIKPAGKKSMLVFWIALAIVSFFVLISLASYGITLWLVIFIVIWFLFFRYLKNALVSGTVSMAMMIIVFLVLSIFSLVFLFPSDENGSGSKVTSTENAENYISVSQANFSGFIFGSSSKDDNKTDTVHLSISPLLNLNVSGFDDDNNELKLKTFEIKNLGFTKKPSLGEVKIIAPTHKSTNEECTGFYLGGCDDKRKPDEIKSSGKNITYKVADNDLTKQAYYDEVGSTFFISPNFRVIVHNIGTFDYDTVMASDKVVSGSKYAQYAGIEASDLCEYFGI